MITESQIYWITRMSSIKNVTIGLGVVAAITYIICWIMVCVLIDDSEEKAAKKLAIVNGVTWLVPFLILVSSIFIPTTKQMCAIKVIPVIANNEGVQELPNKVVDLANEWMEELRPKKEE